MLPLKVIKILMERNNNSFSLFWEIVPGIQCNFKCVNCYAANNARPDKRMLKWNEVKNALDKVIALGARKIDILGGEPFLCKYLKNFVRYFKERVPNGFCGIVSNGSLITKKRAKYLKKAGLSQLTISLDGTTAEINDLSRGKGTFVKALSGIENAVEADISLTISYTVNQFNTEYTHDFISFAQKIGAKAIATQIVEKTGRAKTALRKTNFNRAQGLKAICNMYHTRPAIFTDISTRNLFQDFLNRFLNAELVIGEVRCSGGLSTLMVSSGGDIYPCSAYAYYHDGRQRNKGVNLLSDTFTTITKYVEDKYIKFNNLMRTSETEKFTTCKNCKFYLRSCSPCPLENPAGPIPECEWVKSQNISLESKIFKSKLKLLIPPIEVNKHKIMFPVKSQKEPLYVPMSKQEFQSIVSCNNVSQIVKDYTNNKLSSYKKVFDTTIEFLCKLKSHHIIEIENFKEL